MENNEKLLTPEGLTRWIWQHFVGIPGADLPPYDAEFNLLLENIRKLDRAAFTKGLHEGQQQQKRLDTAAGK